jgi:4a-hydroxytetrahydrobiopterin dehydratase
VANALTQKEFRRSPGVEMWSVDGSVARAKFLTGSFARGVTLVEAIGALADAANHHPDVDLRYSFVTVRLTTHDVHSLSDLDVALARAISKAARELGVAAEDAGALTDPTDAPE